MEKQRFRLLNNIVSLVVLALSALVYLLTIEPTASFWDCGEFIASSYKLEVGHAPGNPTFNLFGRFFTMFTDPAHAAAAVNAMSALCSALTVFFLYLTIVHFGRRILEKRGKELTVGNVIALLASGVVGAMAYCFSDTFWFSAVEGEVYAMSSLFTAVVFWAILKWEEQADQPWSGRWLILIMFLMGLSVGVHLLNLLTLPAIVFIVYYKQKQGKMNFWQGLGVLALSGALIAVVLFGIIPYLPKIAAFFDRLFVNGLGAHFNTGAAVFLILLLAGCFLAMRILRRREKPLWHTVVLCLTVFIIGYSTFCVTVIRSSANTPTNEYQPDNPYTLVRYLEREQYGSSPLLYGQTYNSPYEVDVKKYWTPLDGRYYHAENLVPVYVPHSKMLFPRMWSSFSERDKQFYEGYVKHKKAKRVKVGNETQIVQMPSFGDNLRFFFDYQISYMYLRYFMWNFVGRQNDFHGQVPGDKIHGNWESGIGFLDRARLGDQSTAPEVLKNNRGKNHYFFLPLLLGLLGLFFQIRHDGRGGWVTGLLFLLTGIAIVLYLNQTPYQVRERDYAYAGSFYVFALWIGLGVMGLQALLQKLFKNDSRGTASAVAATVLGLCIPLMMGCQNWDDHDRSGRYTARDMAWNHLMSCDSNALIITHGDNDTFPLWYIQEVESVRTDVRIVNTSLLGTDWYIDQMKRRQYESAPLPIDIDRIQYLYGTNDFPYVANLIDRPILASEAIAIFKNPKFKLSDGKTDYIPAKKLLVKVNKENVRKYGIVPEADMDLVADYLELEIEPDRIGKVDLIILDILANYEWDRPIYYVVPDADVHLGLDKWSQYNGFCYKLVPIKTGNSRDKEYIDLDKMYDRIMNVYALESLAKSGVNYDYQNIYTFEAVVPMREMFVTVAEGLAARGDKKKALAVLDRAVETLPQANFPYNISWMRSINEYALLRIVDLYLRLDAQEKGLALADAFVEETTRVITYFSQEYRGEMLSRKTVEDNFNYFSFLLQSLEGAGLKEKADDFQDRLYDALHVM
jgi:hypothetical protein